MLLIPYFFNIPLNVSRSIFLLVFLPLSFCLPYSHIAVLEVLQFGRDACVAESWLAGQEPLVRAAELGSNVDEVESLIKRHEAFEKLATAWEDRFVLLEKLTTVGRKNTRIRKQVQHVHHSSQQCRP